MDENRKNFIYLKAVLIHMAASIFSIPVLGSYYHE